MPPDPYTGKGLLPIPRPHLLATSRLHGALAGGPMASFLDALAVPQHQENPGAATGWHSQNAKVNLVPICCRLGALHIDFYTKQI